MGPAAKPEPSRPPKPAPSPLTRAEWGLILVLVAVQFTHMVDFVIIMPLGDRLMCELALSEAQFGWVVASYAWAAGLASLAASLVMDRFDRRTVLLVMYAGFAVSTLFCGLASTYELLLLARTLAGVFGGVAAVALNAVIGDVFPVAKRGRAAGAVMSSFAVASIVGLPIGLALAEWLGRGAPFLALAGLSGGVWVLGWYRLPSVRGHLTADRRSKWAEFAAVAREPNHLWAFAFSFFLVLGTFTVASFIGPYLSTTNNWTEKDLAVIYLVAGLCTLVGMNVVGRLSDRLPRRALFQVLAAVAAVMAVVVTNLPPTRLWVATLALSGFMTFAAGRMVPAQAMLLGAAAPRVRGGFLSLNTAVQHFSTGVAPMLTAGLVTKAPDGTLTGYPVVGAVAVASVVVSLVLARFVRPAAEPAVFPPVIEPHHDTPTAEPEPKPAAV